ncbi:hypothetical protein [Nocardia sp. NBC_01388]|uniref:hypothetical protein n=1 Tax=Nocardia sp. NBC_01388 TaxID=2903596 RepID=UPI002F913F27
MFYYSRSGDMAAAWELVGQSIGIMHIRREGDITPAYRIYGNGSRTSLPHRPRGTVYFDEWSRPDFVAVCGQFPAWGKLFDAVRLDYWKYLRELGIAPSDDAPHVKSDAAASAHGEEVPKGIAPQDQRGAEMMA